MFNRKSAYAALIALGALAAGSSAHAGNVQWSVSINLPPVGTVVSNAPVYHPAPVYRVAPVYYPAPVVYAPAPVVVYRPVPVVRHVPVHGAKHGWKHHHRHHHRHAHHHGRGDRWERGPRHRHD